MWFDATGQRFPDPGGPSHDALGTLELRYLANRALDDVPKPVQAFLDRGPDFVTAHSVGELAT